MASIYDILEGPWPFSTRPPEIPEGVLTDVHICGAFTSATLTDLVLSNDSLLVGLVLVYGGGSISATAKVPLVRPNSAYPLVDGAGVTWGRVMVGDVSPSVRFTGGSIGMDPRCILTHEGDTLTPENPPSTSEYTFSGANGITLSLDPDTNIILLGVDEGLYADVDTTENIELQSDLDVGIHAIGNLTGQNVAISIEGLTPLFTITDHYIVITYSLPVNGTDIWTGCEDDTTFQRTVRCSSNDGSETPYPLDDLFCDGLTTDRCPYPWET